MKPRAECPDWRRTCKHRIVEKASSSRIDSYRALNAQSRCDLEKSKITPAFGLVQTFRITSLLPRPRDSPSPSGYSPSALTQRDWPPHWQLAKLPFPAPLV